MKRNVSSICDFSHKKGNMKAPAPKSYIKLWRAKRFIIYSLQQMISIEFHDFMLSINLRVIRIDSDPRVNLNKEENLVVDVS